MRGRCSPFEIVLTPTERSKLEQVVRCTKAPHAKVQRARIVLKFAEGTPISQIAQQLEMPRRIVRKWIKRFGVKRIPGLHDLPRTGRPPSFSPGGSPARREDRVRAA